MSSNIAPRPIPMWEIYFLSLWICFLGWSIVVGYFQAVSDLEKGWTVGSKEAHAKLAELKQKGAKLEVRLPLKPCTQLKAYASEFSTCLVIYCKSIPSLICLRLNNSALKVGGLLKIYTRSVQIFCIHVLIWVWSISLGSSMVSVVLLCS